MAIGRLTFFLVDPIQLSFGVLKNCIPKVDLFFGCGWFEYVSRDAYTLRRTEDETFKVSWEDTVAILNSVF